MGEYEGWTQPPNGLLLNGLLPNEEVSVIRVLNSDRWSKAEERTAELIACIQPNQLSEDRRKAVADYVQRLIIKCLPCPVQVFTFGSVPLKTYLPDGDIDLTTFSESQSLKDSWAQQVRNMLESEEKNENAEFRVKEVQYIQAEVKLIKCLVENIVVDISFNQLGGLCTLCFLEEVDSLINENHLFKRSIILIKAWCYYESRILGAHHGLISTYALETLVLYIFHIYHKKLTGPLEVLFRFLEFFSKFDWDNFCVSLWGPVPVCSLPDVAAEPPRKDDAELLLSKRFLDACGDVYAVLPGGQENQGLPFVSKHFNVIDPLRINNNLGRSVSKGNFFRIRSAFAFGAKRLARLLDCPREDLVFEVNQFFMNTWDRHGCGHRPDAPSNDLLHLRLLNADHVHSSENMKHNTSKKKSENFPSNTQVERTQGSHGASSRHSNSILESTYSSKDVSTVSRSQSQKSYVNQKKEISSNPGTNIGKVQGNSKPDIFLNDNQGRFLFARTHSSPELADTHGEVSSQVGRSRAPESGNSQSTTRLDSSWKNNLESDVIATHSQSSADHSCVSQINSYDGLETVTESNGPLNNYYIGSGLGVTEKGFPWTLETQRMHQEYQEFRNMMTSPTANLASRHLPFSIPSSVIATYRKNMAGMVPTNIPFHDTHWGTNMQLHQGLISSQPTHYFPSMGLTSNTETSVESGSENYRSAEVGVGEVDNDLGHDDDRGSSEGFGLDNRKLEIMYSDDKQPPASAGYNFVPLSRLGSCSSTSSAQNKVNKEKQGSTWENRIDKFQYKENSGTEVSIDDRTASLRYSPAAQGNFSRSKTSSESSWEGLSTKSSRSTKEKWGRKTASSALSRDVYRQGILSDHSSQADPENGDWNQAPIAVKEVTERITGSQYVDSLHLSVYQVPSSEPSQAIGSDSLMPMDPVILGPGSHQKPMDNRGVLPFTFYPTGPPVPFVTMLPVYNFPTESGTSDSATRHLGGEEGLSSTDLSQKFVDSSEGDQSEVINNSPIKGAISVETSAQKSDILSSDFRSHWYNLQYGRHCQDPRYAPPVIYPPPVVVPPVYLQGRFLWDGPGRPLSANMDLFTQLMTYGPQVVPFTPSVSSRPGGVYQRFADEMPRHRSGTGTYLPNPKASVRDRQMSSTRRENNSYDRSDRQTDREGNWSNNSKSRATGRRHSHTPGENLSSRPDRSAASESRAERSRSTNRHTSYPLFQSQNGPIHSNAHITSASLACGMYPLPAMNQSGVSSNGPSIPPLVMLYPYDHSTGYGLLSNEQPEFGSLGSLGFSDVNDAQLSEGSQSTEVFEEHRCDSAPVQQSSLNQLSSPHLRRGV